MGDLVGIIKELREGEKVSFDSKSVVPIFLVKEVETKGMFGRSQKKEVPTALMYATVYTTNRRLLFLVFYQVPADDVRKGGANVRLSELSAKWFAIPIESVQHIEVRSLDSRDAKGIRQFLQNGGETAVAERTGVELVYGERELTDEDRDFSRSLLRMGALQRLTTKAEGISDKLFIGAEHASLLALSVQAEMGILKSLEAAPQMATQQFSVLDPDTGQPSSGGEQ